MGVFHVFWIVQQMLLNRATHHLLIYGDKTCTLWKVKFTTGLSKEILTSQNTKILPNFLLCKLCGVPKSSHRVLGE